MITRCSKNVSKTHLVRLLACRQRRYLDVVETHTSLNQNFQCIRSCPSIDSVQTVWIVFIIRCFAVTRLKREYNHLEHHSVSISIRGSQIVSQRVLYWPISWRVLNKCHINRAATGFVRPAFIDTRWYARSLSARSFKFRHAREKSRGVGADLVPNWTQC